MKYHKKIMKVVNNKEMLADFIAKNEMKKEVSEKSDSDVEFKALDGISDDTSDLESEASQLHRKLDLKTDEGFYNALRK